MDQEIVVVNKVRAYEGGPSLVAPTGGPGLSAGAFPAGGSVTGRGIQIEWQDGPLGRGAERIEPNGAFVEGVIKAAASRLEFYQSSKFKCPENAVALSCLYSALDSLNRRTATREKRDVEGTHQV